MKSYVKVMFLLFAILLCADVIIADNDSRCRENESWSEKPTRICEPLCEAPYRTVCPPLPPRAACRCNAGFVLSLNKHKCVKLEDCIPTTSTDVIAPDARCGENESWSERPNPICEPLCEAPKRTVCPPLPSRAACRCNRGFVRNRDTQKCIKFEHCFPTN